MSKGIILFQSKYGATKKYADWLAEMTGYDCAETKNANAVMSAKKVFNSRGMIPTPPAGQMGNE